MAKRRNLIHAVPGMNLDELLDDGRPVILGDGTYPHDGNILTVPDGATVVGNGISRAIVEAALSVGSADTLRGFTAGKSASGRAHRFRPGAHHTVFGDMRFRAPGSVRVWDACDYTPWGSAPLRNRAHFQDMYWGDCEWEYSGRDDCVPLELWWDSREGGGEVHSLTFDHCTFGVRNAAGRFSPQRVGILFQAAPPEHGTNGPRPGSSIDYDFDWSPVTHGMGIPGEQTIRFYATDWLGACSLASLDVADFMRSYLMTTTRKADGTPKYTSSTNGTQAERDACPDAMCIHGIYISPDCRFADSYIPEIGRDCPDKSFPDHMGDNAVTYFARESVLQHDAELYGLEGP
jgi:hypothetical protein